MGGLKLIYSVFKTATEKKKKNNRKRQGVNQKHVSGLQMKQNTYSLCNGVYRNSQQHGLEDFCKNVKTIKHMFIVYSQRPQRLFMMAEVMRVFAKKVTHKAEAAPSL